MNDIKELCRLYNELLKFPAELRLSFALTALDEASEVLNFSPEEINILRTKTYNELGDFYGNE